MLASVRGKLGVISMDAEFLLQSVQAAVVVIGVGFAAYELRKYREERNREAALELVHTFQTPEFAKALLIVCELPDGLSKAEIEAHVGEDFYLVYGDGDHLGEHRDTGAPRRDEHRPRRRFLQRPDSALVAEAAALLF